MISRTTAADFLPDDWTWESLREAAAQCQGCELYKHATQTVFGEGPQHADLMLVGEVPGDQEDQLGHPFVGPAGHLLDEALQEVGLNREEAYITNAVKHFKWEQRGSRRMHKKPGLREISACHPWLEAEIQLVKPQQIVCLGATAAQALLGRDFRITRQRGQLLSCTWAPSILATYHPSAILRAPEKKDRDRMRDEFLTDLRCVSEHLRELRAPQLKGG